MISNKCLNRKEPNLYRSLENFSNSMVSKKTIERFRFSLRLTLNVRCEYPCHVMSNFRSPTRMQAKNIYIDTSHVLCIRCLECICQLSSHIKTYFLPLDDEPNHLMLYISD